MINEIMTRIGQQNFLKQQKRRKDYFAKNPEAKAQYYEQKAKTKAKDEKIKAQAQAQQT